MSKSKNMLRTFLCMLFLLCAVSFGSKAQAAQNYPTVYKGQDYSRVYDFNYYIKKYPSVLKTCKTKKQVLANFVTVGIPGKRIGCKSFNVKSYIYGNPDLRKAYKNNIAKYYLHYQKSGYRNRKKTAVGIRKMQRTWTVYNGINYASVYDYEQYALSHKALLKKYMYNDYGLLQYYVTHDFRKGLAGKKKVKNTALAWIRAKREQSFLAKTKTASVADQIILVVDHELTTWNKQANGTWKRAISSYCGYGKNGLSANRHEGDMTTPIGSYPILYAFGKAANPGSGLAYRRITKNSYYSDEPESYNSWVESPVKIRGEHLTDYYQYEYAMSIGFNINPTVLGKGSAIFLHCKSNDHWYTAGCVSVPQATMKQIIQNAKPKTYMIIVKSDVDIVKY